MRLLTSLEVAILKLSPDELAGSLEALLYLSNPANAAFLAEYQATWADAIEARRKLP